MKRKLIMDYNIKVPSEYFVDVRTILDKRGVEYKTILPIHSNTIFGCTSDEKQYVNLIMALPLVNGLRINITRKEVIFETKGSTV